MFEFLGHQLVMKFCGNLAVTICGKHILSQLYFMLFKSLSMSCFKDHLSVLPLPKLSSSDDHHFCSKI